MRCFPLKDMYVQPGGVRANRCQHPCKSVVDINVDQMFVLLMLLLNPAAEPRHDVLCVLMMFEMGLHGHGGRTVTSDGHVQQAFFSVVPRFGARPVKLFFFSVFQQSLQFDYEFL